MRKSVKIAIACFIVLVETFGFILVLGLALGRHESSDAADPYANASIFPVMQSVTKRDAYTTFP